MGGFYMSYRFYDAIEHKMWLELSLGSDGYFGNVSLVQEGKTLWEFRLDVVSAGELYDLVADSVEASKDTITERSVTDSFGETLIVATYLNGVSKPVIAFSTADIADDICWLSIATAKQLRTTLRESLKKLREGLNQILEEPQC